MIRVLTVTDAFTDSTVYLNPMHIVSITVSEGMNTQILISRGMSDQSYVLHVKEDGKKLAETLERALRNLGNSPQ